MRFSLAILASFGFLACTGPTAGPSAGHGPKVTYHKAEGAIGPYSSAVQVGGLVMLSGKIGTRGEGFEHEVTTCIDRIEGDLGTLGLELSDVVEARVYLTDMNRYADFNAIYGARFTEPYPARTCVAVAALPAGAQVEIQVAARAR